jgi:hypothetical protein
MPIFFTNNADKQFQFSHFDAEEIVALAADHFEHAKVNYLNHPLNPTAGFSHYETNIPEYFL